MRTEEVALQPAAASAVRSALDELRQSPPSFEPRPSRRPG
eukprot:CAMPEP_0116924094 /NCGR_PEP_ID=MMETSP0467-20121206/23289_1 /TAXON_ID=283647 /ORGANISM="Mesodinium pulex, Strain SPMC105" /LENGTH=39 /DNA_ID= /DNA_START= /DNA_END= /DNA_ORIENTATION=